MESDLFDSWPAIVAWCKDSIHRVETMRALYGCLFILCGYSRGAFMGSNCKDIANDGSQTE